MNHNKHIPRATSLCALFLVLLIGCKPLISVYDQYAYTQGTTLKVDALNLMDKATQPYQGMVVEVEATLLKLKKAYEYESHRPQNEITTKMWSIMNNPEKNLFAGFIKRWQTKSVLEKEFIDQAKQQVSETFDMIIELESQKIKASDSKVKTFLSQNQ